MDKEEQHEKSRDCNGQRQRPADFAKDDGYAENFLIKNGLAVKYTDGSKKRLQNELETRALEEDLLVKKCQSDKEKIEKLTLTFKVKVGQNGKIFGTISSKQIAEELNKKGFNIDKKIIELDHQIDTLGIHKVSVKLHKKVVASLTISVKEV